MEQRQGPKKKCMCVHMCVCTCGGGPGDSVPSVMAGGVRQRWYL